MSVEGYPWIRQHEGTAEHPKGESSIAYDAFRVYMNLGADRSILKVSESVGKAPSLLNRWCTAWRWVERAAAYDSYLTTAQVDGEADEFAQVRNSHLDLASKLLTHLAESMSMWKPGADPSIRWTTAFTAAAKVHQTALTLKETTSKTDEEAIAKILAIVSKQGEA